MERAPIAVIGATGQQGSEAVQALLEQETPVRALVRDPDSSGARALAARGVELRRADQEDERSLAEGLEGVEALFFMTTFAGADGPVGEVRRGLAVAQAAARAGVPRVVYSSVGAADRGTGIPHFESKRKVEERLAELLPVTFVRPTFFMENLAPQLTPDASGEIVLRMPMPGDVPVQMVAVRDVGRAAARLVLDPSAIRGDAVELAGDELTLDQAAERVGRLLGAPARYEGLPIEVLGDDEDAKAMFQWFTAGDAYRGDFAVTSSLVPDVSDLGAWIAAQRVGVSG